MTEEDIINRTAAATGFTPADLAGINSADSQVDPAVAMKAAKEQSVGNIMLHIDAATKNVLPIMNAAKAIILYQAEELEIFRVMEIYLKRGTITEGIIAATLEKLEAVRGEMKRQLLGAAAGASERATAEGNS